MYEDKITKINEVIAVYFKENSEESSVPVKNLMPDFISAGIFNKDEKKGLPIRKILRKLDVEKQLAMIPFVHAERQEKNVYWYFLKPGAEFVSKATKPSAKTTALRGRVASDEFFILDLCDVILKKKASRQHKFGFILGDLHKDGETRTRLPLDAYYADLNLVIEFLEKQHAEGADVLEKPTKVTVSGVGRVEQRKIYDRRKRQALKEKDIKLIDIDYSMFECDEQEKIIRNTEAVKIILSKLLKDFV